MINLITGKLFRVSGEFPIGVGYCGNDVQPTAGQAVLCSEHYTLVIATEDECDDDGNLECEYDGIEIEAVEPEMGFHDGDGTARLVLVKEGRGFDYVFASVL